MFPITLPGCHGCSLDLLGEQVFTSRSTTNDLRSDSQLTPDTGSPAPETGFNISNEEAIRRLRSKGQPTRLFGESDKDRRLRLRALELIEEKGHDRHGGQNDFKKALEDVESSEREMRAKNKGKKKDEAETDTDGTGVIDLALVKTNPDKLYPVIYYALKRKLKEWEESMDERPGRLPITSVPIANVDSTCQITSSGRHKGN